MSVRVRRARSRTGSVSGEHSFARGLAEEMLAFSPYCPPASRTESMSGVPAPTGRKSCEGELATLSVGGLGFSWKPTGGLSRTDGVRRLGSAKCGWGSGVEDGAGSEGKHVRVDRVLLVVARRHFHERCRVGVRNKMRLMGCRCVPSHPVVYLRVLCCIR